MYSSNNLGDNMELTHQKISTIVSLDKHQANVLNDMIRSLIPNMEVVTVYTSGNRLLKIDGQLYLENDTEYLLPLPENPEDEMEVIC